MSENCSLIFVSPDSLYKEDDKEDGDILGEIWLEVDGFAFPEKHWHDSVIILGEWLETLFKVWSEQKTRGECYFFDFEYSFEVSAEGGAFILRCFRKPLSVRDCRWEGTIDLTALLRQALEAAAAIIEEYQRRGLARANIEDWETRWIYLDGVLNPQSA